MTFGGFIKLVVSRFFPTAMFVKGREKKTISITFDDGPHETNTLKILSILKDHGVKANFFLQGQEAERLPHLVRAIHDGGHEIGNHAYHHSDCRKISADAFVAEVIQAQEMMEAIVGTSLAKDVRPPYGSISFKSFIALVRRGYRYVMWTDDSEDSFVGSSEQLIERVKGLSLGDGAVLLFHEDYDLTVEALPTLLEHFSENGFNVKTIGEMR